MLAVCMDEHKAGERAPAGTMVDELQHPQRFPDVVLRDAKSQKLFENLLVYSPVKVIRNHGNETCLPVIFRQFRISYG